jgi:hypothetical protein
MDLGMFALMALPVVVWMAWMCRGIELRDRHERAVEAEREGRSDVR